MNAGKESGSVDDELLTFSILFLRRHSQAGLIHAASASHLSSPSAPTSFFHRMSYGAMSASASSIPSGRNLTVAVLGSTGGIGRNVVKHALAHPDIGKVIAIVRRARPADMGQGVADPKLQEVVVDFANLTAEPFAGASIVYCCLGSTIAAAGSQEEFKKQDHDLILRCGEKAREAESVQQFCLVSSVGADPHTGNFYLKTKGPRGTPSESEKCL
jgi:hypothetical protein